MLDKINNLMMILSIVALCAFSVAATHTGAQTGGCAMYVPAPNDGYFTYPAKPAIISMPTSTAIPAPASAPAREYATVYGIVTDSSGTAVAGAIVRLEGPSGAQYSTTSGKDGYYEISNVPYDPYTFSYTHGSYSSPATTLAVNTNSVEHEISLPAQAEGTSATRQAPAAIDHSAIKNWYATYYTPPTLSNQSVIYDQSGRIVKVVTGNPCNIAEVPVSGH